MMNLSPPLSAGRLKLAQGLAWLAPFIRWTWLLHLFGRLRQRRVPVLLQLSDVECGAACLAMVLGYHGQTARVTECAARIGTGRDGTTALGLAQAARTFGLRVRAYTLEPADLGRLPTPAILHWNFAHFVVLERWSERGVDIVNPAGGRRRLLPTEVDAAFTGVALACEPGALFDRGVQSAPAWRRYLRSYVLQAPGVLAQVLVASLILQVLGLVLPVATAVLVDRVLPLRMTGALPILAVGMGLLVLTQALTSYLRAALLLHLQARVDARTMLGFLEHLLSLPYRFFAQRSSGDLLLRLNSNAAIREALTGQTLSVLLDGTLVFGYLAVLLARDTLFGGLVLAIALLQVALVLATGRRMHDLTQRDLMAQAMSQGYLVEALTGIATVKACGAESRVLDRWTDLFHTALEVGQRRSHLAAVVDATLGALRVAAPLALLWVGATRVLDGAMTLGTMLALAALGGAVLTPLASLVASAQRIQLVGAHLERLTDVLDADPEQDPGMCLIEPVSVGRIDLRGVGFRCDPQAPWVLRDISLTVEPGQKVALVGATGCGKSTLAKLLLGLYEPAEGEIQYGGVPAVTIDRRALRRRCGVVPQEPVLFSGSIRDNIAFGAPDLGLPEVEQAASLAAIDAEIARMPMGYETRVGEGGAGLSGGQRQRLTLARALASRPELLLLDEATSHLDVATEALVERNLVGLACTRIVIAHRLSTVRDADLILVLDGGTIVERGSHEELMVRGGHYAALVGGQLGPEPSDVTERVA